MFQVKGKCKKLNTELKNWLLIRVAFVVALSFVSQNVGGSLASWSRDHAVREQTRATLVKLSQHLIIICCRVWVFLTPTNEGYIFKRVCDSVHREGGCASVHAGIHPRADTPGQTHLLGRHPPGADTPRSRHPSLCSACWEIRETSGLYASYWNAYLLFTFLLNI